MSPAVASGSAHERALRRLDPEAEATRMEWLKQAFADRQMCGDGYDITGRTLVAAQQEALGQTHNIAYHGVCKK